MSIHSKCKSACIITIIVVWFQNQDISRGWKTVTPIPINIPSNISKSNVFKTCGLLYRLQ